MPRTKTSAATPPKTAAAPARGRARAEDLEDYAFPGHDSLGLLLRVAMSGLRRAFKEQLAEHNVPWSMWYYLRVLWERDGLSQKELIARVGMLQPNAVSSIQAMQEAGLVTVQRSDTDARRSCIRLTDKGRALQQILLPKVRGRVERVAFHGFADTERAQLMALLERVCTNVTRPQPD